jgi:outer membrane lipoprotein carrier protein
MLTFLIGFLFSAQAGATPAAPSANDVVDNVQKFYKDIKQVTASFRQTVHISTFGTDKTSDGTVWLMKPGKMRWDYLEKKKSEVQVKKSFISNGTTLYVVEHDNKQVVQKNLQQDLMPVAVSFLYGKGDLKAEFTAALDTAATYGNKGDIVIKLTPKKPSAQYKNLILVVDKAQFRVKESVIIDSANNVNHFQFFQPDFDKPIKDSWFEFNPDSVNKTYRIVNGDAPQPAPAGSAAGSAAPAPAPAPVPVITPKK